jgi:ArsR family transcriptional regulator
MSNSSSVELPDQADGAAARRPPISAGELSPPEAEKMAAMFHALSSPVRLRILSKVASHPDGEACVCDIADVGVSQPTVSHHLKKLREAGLLVGERRGTWVFYQVAPSAMTTMAAMLDLRDRAQAALSRRSRAESSAADTP